MHLFLCVTLFKFIRVHVKEGKKNLKLLPHRTIANLSAYRSQTKLLVSGMFQKDKMTH